MKVHIDSQHCVGHAQCAANAPDVFVLDERGYALAPAGEIPAELVQQAKRAADACPERAITLS
jgi:ferredoxin